MAPKTKSIPSVVRDTTLFLRDLSRTPNDVILDKVTPALDNQAYRRRAAPPPRHKGTIPGNLEWPKCLLEFVAENRLRGFCLDAVFQILTAPCDHPCPGELTSIVAHLCVKSFLDKDNQTLLEECKTKSKYPVQDANEKIEDVPLPYDANSVMQRLMTHLTSLASTWLKEGVAKEGGSLAAAVKSRAAAHSYNAQVIPPIDAAARLHQNSQFEDSDSESDDESANCGNDAEPTPVRKDLLPPAPADIENSSYQGFVHAIKNTRRKMEDRHVIIPDLNLAFDVNIPGSGSFFGVFDGHGGVETSAFAAAQLPLAFANFLVADKDPAVAFERAFNAVDQQFAVKSKRENLKSGSTGVACFLSGSSLYLSWLGDSQALLLRGVPGLNVRPLPAHRDRLEAEEEEEEEEASAKYDDVSSSNSDGASNGHHEQPDPTPSGYLPEPRRIMIPHRPDREDEKRRIEALGGIVIWFGTWRVNGSIAVSRSIGDVEHKPFVSADCDCREIELGCDDDLLILGCDGLFDTLDPTKIAECVYDHLSQPEGGSVANLPHKLVKEAKNQGSSDNITALVVPLIHHKKREWSLPKEVASVAENLTNSSIDSEQVLENQEQNE